MSFLPLFQFSAPIFKACPDIPQFQSQFTSRNYVTPRSKSRKHTPGASDSQLDLKENMSTFNIVDEIKND